MKVLPLLQRRLGFTHNEVRVVLFLSATFLTGLGIRWYDAARKRHDTIPFDYTRVDSEFAARSMALASLPPSLTRPQLRLSPPQANSQRREHQLNAALPPHN